MTPRGCRKVWRATPWLGLAARASSGGHSAGLQPWRPLPRHPRTGAVQVDPPRLEAGPSGHPTTPGVPAPATEWTATLRGNPEGSPEAGGTIAGAVGLAKGRAWGANKKCPFSVTMSVWGVQNRSSESCDKQSTGLVATFLQL